MPQNMVFRIEGYHNVFSKCREDMRGGGVCTYIKSNIPVQVINSLFVSKICKTLCVKTTIQKKKIYFLNVYFGQNNKMEAIKLLKDFIATLRLKSSHICLLSDFNICMQELGTLPEADYIFDCITANAIYPQVNFPTRIITVNNKLQSSSIDNIFISQKF